MAVDEGSVSASVHDLASSINDVNLSEYARTAIATLELTKSNPAGPVDQENTSAESVDAQEMPADATSLEDDNQAVQDDNDDEESEDEEDFHVQV